ncbi:hypothetical protein LTR70_003659 [Exophiala xenobiotica]|uniref:Uncharacterized protein n=1 Tax=Lithohypha guttulata TaxID=1690604 RepID=A0ABR0KFM2_9EURO|nr:hypothetical protein LTR24_003150 [Lithohypha guttulata]KAK5322872.1 hypothetical protein LTR70_003659 [Exophiala xenobiotica]
MEDAKGHEAEHPYYRYGGMWKNRHVDGPASAKKPKRVKDRQKCQEAQRPSEGGDRAGGQSEPVDEGQAKSDGGDGEAAAN